MHNPAMSTGDRQSNMSELVPVIRQYVAIQTASVEQSCRRWGCCGGAGLGSSVWWSLSSRSGSGTRPHGAGAGACGGSPVAIVAVGAANSNLAVIPCSTVLRRCKQL